VGSQVTATAALGQGGTSAARDASREGRRRSCESHHRGWRRRCAAIAFAKDCLHSYRLRRFDFLHRIGNKKKQVWRMRKRSGDFLVAFPFCFRSGRRCRRKRRMYGVRSPEAVVRNRAAPGRSRSNQISRVESVAHRNYRNRRFVFACATPVFFCFRCGEGNRSGAVGRNASNPLRTR